MLKFAAIARRWIARCTPHADTRHGIATAFGVAAWLGLAVLSALLWWQGPSVYTALGLLLLAATLVFAVLLAYLLIGLLARLTPRMRWALLLISLVAIGPFLFIGPVAIMLMALVILSVALIGAGVAHYRRLPRHWATYVPLSLGVGLLACWLGFLVVAGWSVEDEVVWQAMQDAPLEVADPSKPGAYAYTSFTYGPGVDVRRPAFGANVRFKTSSVDGSKLLDGWDGIAGWARSRYWSATAEALPIRGRVWMPAGSGPFPIVLMVHGNHAMEDASDDGYGYLGEHFASRGYIAVSVDQNFLNSSTADFLSFFDGGLEEENDARGWLLLEHLRQWRIWNADPQHELHARVDLQRVVLIGHSRGGEAVSEAAVFNRLPAYPDDATLKFDYNFGLAGVIAIAPVDSQYDPRGRATHVADVNYLVIHGSHDTDVDAFVGEATYNRISFDNCATCFKSSHYLVGANHGQFNTGWGKYDVPAPISFLLNTQTMIDAEHQRRVAKAVFTAFLESVIRKNPAYRAFLAAPHRVKWLPAGTRMLSNYLHAADLMLANYEEDADVSSGSRAGVAIQDRGLSLWREQEVALKWSDTDSAMVLLGWQTEGNDAQQAPAYRLAVAPQLAVKASQALAFSLAMSTESPLDDEDYAAPELIDLSIVVSDAAGEKAVLLLSKRRSLLPQIDPMTYKLRGLNSNAGSEVVMQRYRFGFDEFLDSNPQLDLQTLQSIELVFDQTAKGSLWLDDVNISNNGI